MESTLYAGAVAFAFLASMGAIVWGWNTIQAARARMARRCYLTGEK